MVANQRVEHVGDLIRQLRRQRNLTQTELGGDRYSKSYVSAVEKHTIRPSSSALQFFAKQLEQRSDYFTVLLESSENTRQATPLPGPLEIENQFLQNDGFSLLHLLMQRAEPLPLQNLKPLPSLAPEVLAVLPAYKQSYYFLLEGLTALAQQDYEMALEALERALPLAPPQLRPLVLDTLGRYYSSTGSASFALHYHLRALATLQHADAQETKNSLLFPIALHCGEDFRILGDYEQAQVMYEQARKYLRAEHEMKNAARLYLGLGHCAYALAYRRSQMPEAAARALTGEMEQEFQRAISYLVQSRNICQVSRDRKGETTSRLLQTVALLDYITRYRQLISPIGATFAVSSLPFLNGAEEQCHQVLIGWNDVSDQGERTNRQNSIIYEALAHLLRVFVLRASLMRMRRQDSDALRERIYAAYLCQQILNGLAQPAFLWQLLREILEHQPAHSLPASPALPHLPDLPLDTTTFDERLTGLVDVYCAAGEVAEEMGRAADTPAFKRDCYSQADFCFHTALTLARPVVSARQRDPSYLIHCYQRYASLLEERLAASPEEHEETCSVLADLLKEGLMQSQSAVQPE